MGSRQENETMMQYLFRQFREAPTAALSVVLICAVVGLWQNAEKKAEEHRQYMKEQNALQVTCIKEQTASFVLVGERLKHIESRLEAVEKTKEH